ncbi:MAG: DUF4175 family protein [Bacteroidia bacterium]
MNGSEYNQLLLKLDEFIRKFYKNQLIRGAIYAIALLLLFYLGVSTLEYFGEFSTTVRTVLFYSFILSSAYILTSYVVVPLLKLNKLGKIISHEEAANIVGGHFNNVQDKLLNVLQLQQNKADALSAVLLQASINQKIAELKPVPFTSAIDLRENRKYLKYAMVPLFAFLGILVVAPKILSKGTDRLIHHASYFEKQAPFTFEIRNKDLKVVQQQDFELKVKLKGDEVPNEMYVLIDGNEFKLNKENISSFTYTFKNVQQSIDFQLSGGGFKSRQYELTALPKPTLMNFDVYLKYPAYLNRKDEIVNNTGDLIIPQGTKLSWSFSTKNTDFLSMRFADTLLRLDPSGQNKFSYTRRLMQSTGYTVNTGNALVSGSDSMNYSINVIADAYPVIEVNEKHDSLKPNAIYFSGMVRDDYGFNQLTFRYNKFSSDSSGKNNTLTKEIVLPIQKNQLSQPYIHYFDMSTLELKPGDKVEYYFEVWDNDGVNGTKSAKTGIMVYKAPTLDELEKQTAKNNQDIKNDIDESIKKAKDLQKEVNELNKKVLEKKQLGWEEKKKLEDLLEKQKSLEKKIENIKQENQLNNQQKNEYQQPNENLLEKQKQLEQLFENIMTPEMKKLFDELQKLMDKMDKNKVQETLEKMKMTDKDLEKELDRTLEQFKQMEAEQKMENLTKKLDEMAKKQEELSKETANEKNSDKKDEKNADKKDDKNADKKDSKDQNGNENKDKKNEKNAENKAGENKPDDKKSAEEKQAELNKEFEKFKEEAKELDKLNKELENPMSVPDTKQEQEKVSQDQQNASDQLNKNNKKNASKSQKSAADQMKSMSDKMQQAMEQMQQDQNEEDMQALRQIMENLMNVSFAEEDLAKESQKIKTNNPQYTKLAQKQKKLQDDSKMIEDSLLALSKRNPMISATVNKEINSIQHNMGKSIESLEERQTQEASMRQQSAMTSINELALMLNEALENMQAKAKQKKGEKEGSGSCRKPGGKGKKPSQSMANMRQMQEQLNKQIEQMKKMMEQGKQPGGKKPGDKQGNGMGMMPGQSEQLAKMAAEQEAIRRAMQEALQKMQKNGQNPGGNLADKMEETENDLVNKVITQETMRRQQEILTKLLEHEKAERERELDEKRQSNEAKNENYSNPNLFLEYKRLKEQELELLKTVPPSLSPYYRTKVSSYFNNFNK